MSTEGNGTGQGISYASSEDAPDGWTQTAAPAGWQQGAWDDYQKVRARAKFAERQLAELKPKVGEVETIKQQLQQVQTRHQQELTLTRVSMKHPQLGHQSVQDHVLSVYSRYAQREGDQAVGLDKWLELDGTKSDPLVSPYLAQAQGTAGQTPAQPEPKAQGAGNAGPRVDAGQLNPSLSNVELTDADIRKLQASGQWTVDSPYYKAYYAALRAKGMVK